MVQQASPFKQSVESRLHNVVDLQKVSDDDFQNSHPLQLAAARDTISLRRWLGPDYQDHRLTSKVSAQWFLSSSWYWMQVQILSAIATKLVWIVLTC